MRDIFKYGKLAKYPHMKPKDIAIWERFILKFPDIFGSVQYDFHVGDPPPFNSLMDDGEDRNQDALYRLKIDVVAHNDNGIHIIELKPDAGPSTIGQVKGYKTLYIRDEEPLGKINMSIITDIERPNMAFLCKAEGIQLIVV